MRVLGVRDVPSGAADGDRDVGVLGERGAREAARVEQRLAAERADRARHGRHAAQHVVEAAVEVEAHHVLDVLPAAQKAAPVADLRVAGHGADALVAERLHQLLQRARLEDRVGVDGHDHVVVCGAEPRVERGRLTAVRLAQHAHRRVDPFNDVAGAVSRPVVDDDHLEVRVGAVHERAHRAFDPDRLVVRGYDDRHGRGEAGVRRPAADVACVATRERDQHEHPDHGQDRDRREQEREGRGDPGGDRECREQQLPARPLPAARLRLNGSGRQAGEVRDAHEAEAASSKRRDQACQRGHGLRPVPAAVVQQDNPAARPARRGVSHDLRDARAGPITAVEIRQRKHVAAARDVAQGRELPRHHRGGSRRVRRTHQPWADAGRSGHRVLRQAELQRALPAGDRGDVDMAERVVADLEPFVV